MGNIRIYVFYESSNQKTHTNAQNVWNDVSNNFANAEYIFGVNVDQEGANSLIQDFKINKIPTTVFVEVIGPKTGKTIARIEGAASYNKIKEVYVNVLTGIYQNSTGNDGENDTILDGDGDGNSFGFGLGPGENKNPWLMLLIAGIIFYSLNKKDNG